MPSIRIDHQSFCCWKDFCRWNWGLLPNKKKEKERKQKMRENIFGAIPRKAKKKKE